MAISYISCQFYDQFTAMKRNVKPCGYPQMDLEQAEKDGKFIQKQILTDRCEYLYRSTRKRVIQEMPNKRSWDLFKKVIESMCDVGF